MFIKLLLILVIASTSYGLMINAPYNAFPHPENSETIQALFSNFPYCFLTLTNSNGYRVSPSLKQVFSIKCEMLQRAHLSSMVMCSWLKIKQPCPNSS